MLQAGGGLCMKFLRFFRFSLRREIAAIVVVKVLLIFALWYICFSHPVENQLTVQKMQQKIIGQ